MAEWFMEGFLETLTNEHNGFSLRSLKHAVFYVVGVLLIIPRKFSTL